MRHGVATFGRTTSEIEADRNQQFDCFEEFAGATAEPGAARHLRSDRRHDRIIDPDVVTGSLPLPEAPRVTWPIQRPPGGRSWRQRVIRNLLYGRNVDRAAKARVRVGFVIILFGLIYAVIATRLVMFATFPDGRGGHRAASQDAIATARPDIIDRNGQALATDIKAPSLFGEPRRIIDRGRGGRTTDGDAARSRDRRGSSTSCDP